MPGVLCRRVARKPLIFMVVLGQVFDSNAAVTHVDRKYLDDSSGHASGSVTQRLDALVKAKSHACDHPGCNYAAKRKEHLAVHKRRKHTSERPYACTHPGCGYVAAQSCHLARHKLQHTGERPYACTHPGCSYAATQIGNLATHKKRHKH